MIKVATNGNRKFFLGTDTAPHLKGDKENACSDYKKAISLGSASTENWLQTDGGTWCRNMTSF